MTEATPSRAAASVRRVGRRTMRATSRRAPNAPPRWSASRGRASLFLATIVLLGAALLAVGVVAIVGLATLRTDVFDLNTRCRQAAFSCGVLGGLLVSLVPIILAVLTLLLWRLRRVRNRYQHRAQEAPERLVQTTLAAKDIVGRNDLCDVIQLSLDNHDARRPHVLVGGVGAGKTAVLVRLTARLAEAGAVPVPVRLRDARDELDFLDLARRRFRREVESGLVSGDEGDKIWRELLEQDRIVVLADGLEEALVDGQLERARDTAIRTAVADAHARQLPLVITSRPHDALRYLDAALLQVEPLPEAAAARYIRGGRAESNPKIDLIVEKAEVVETPLYMRIARELHEAGRLRDVDTRLVTRLALRVRLLDAWTDALVQSHIHARVAVPPKDRERALADLQALACVGLATDTLEVAFDSLNATPTRRRTLRGPKPLPAYEPVLTKDRRDVRLAASVGGRLDLVEPLSKGVRFRHSIMQAYLGSQALPLVLEDTDYLDQALAGHEGQGPGRELIMALVMLCFRDRRWRDQVCEELMIRAQGARSAKAVDMVAAAVEIDGMRRSVATPHSEAVAAAANAPTAQDLSPIWRRTRDPETEEAKLRATTRLGEVGRGQPSGIEQAAEAGTSAQQVATHPEQSLAAHRALWWIGQYEQDECYAVRLAAAQQIGAGGSLALEALREEFREALASAQERFGGRSGEADPGVLRLFALQGWVLPMLAGSVNEADADEVKQLIRDWVALLRRGVHVSVEISWAQGFKFEANRRGREVDLGVRDFLVEQAEGFNEKARFWFSRMSLLHAFTLWVLEAERQEALSATVAHDEEAGRRTRLQRVSRRARGEVHAAAKRRVSGWVSAQSHPLVNEAARLCEQALETRQPGSFLWIDEAGVVSKLGPSTTDQAEIADSRLWISSAAGWLALDKRAQQLVADVVLLLNLAERGDPLTLEQRLERTGANGSLPACLTVSGGREHMGVGGEQSARSLRPGSTCRAGCDGHFCPYPVPGNTPFRGELSEAFCRGQRQILERFGRKAPWHDASRKELAHFWSEMERRARLEA